MDNVGSVIVPIGRVMAVIIAGGLLLVGTTAAGSESDTFPGATWQGLGSPADWGWSAEKLAEARTYTETIDTGAVMIVHGGIVVAQWGDVATPYMCESIRKSLLSALIGTEIDAGRINLTSTLAELNIDDKEPALTRAESRATVRDLLTSRSGIYHRAAYEPSSMARNRPERGSAAPGQHFFYNNWDFNTLGTVFERAANTSIFEAFDARIATPLGMEDFERERDTRYVRSRASDHPAYLFNLSTRDLARFGLLYARGGRWDDQQIVPSEWVDLSATPHVPDAGRRGAYGYLWWVADPDTGNLFGVETEPGAFMASGSGGHRLLVMPRWDLVIVHRVGATSTLSELDVSHAEYATFLKMVLDARPQR